MYYDVGYYGTRMIAWNAMPTDPTFAADGARTIWERHVAEDEPYLLAWLTHQVDGPYWRQGSVADIVDRIVCPTFLIGGWRDGYPNPPTRLFERLTGPEEAAHRPVGSPLPGRRDPRPPDRPPARRRPLARSLVPRARRRPDGRARDRGVHAGGGFAGTRPAGEHRTVAGRDGLAAGGRRRARLRPRGRRTPVRRRRPARTPSRPAPTASSSIRPSGWPTGCGRAASSSG